MRLWFKLVAWGLAIAGLLGGALYWLFFDVWIIPGDDPMLSVSLAPTLDPGDVLVLARTGRIDRGNLVRCADPQAPGRYVVARAIGQSGDRLQIEGEMVSVDGHRDPSPRACEFPTVTVHDPGRDEDLSLACTTEEYGERDFSALRAVAHPEPPVSLTVAPGMWFLVSDDRHLHVDSRDYGPIDPRTCQHIVFRLLGAGGLGDDRPRFGIVW